MARSWVRINSCSMAGFRASSIVYTQTYNISYKYHFQHNRQVITQTVCWMKHKYSKDMHLDVFPFPQCKQVDPTGNKTTSHILIFAHTIQSVSKSLKQTYILWSIYSKSQSFYLHLSNMSGVNMSTVFWGKLIEPTCLMSSGLFNMCVISGFLWSKTYLFHSQYSI